MSVGGQTKIVPKQDTRRVLGLRPGCSKKLDMPTLGVTGKEGCLRAEAEPRASMSTPQGQRLLDGKLHICPAVICTPDDDFPSLHNCHYSFVV